MDISLQVDKMQFFSLLAVFFFYNLRGNAISHILPFHSHYQSSFCHFFQKLFLYGKVHVVNIKFCSGTIFIFFLEWTEKKTCNSVWWYAMWIYCTYFLVQVHNRNNWTKAVTWKTSLLIFDIYKPYPSLPQGHNIRDCSLLIIVLWSIQFILFEEWYPDRINLSLSRFPCFTRDALVLMYCLQ